MDQELKALAIQNLTARLALRMTSEHQEELKWAQLDPLPNVKQGLTEAEVLKEIKNETKTGEAYVLAAIIDPDKSEEENKVILSKFIERRRAER